MLDSHPHSLRFRETRFPQTQTETLPPDLVDRFRRDCTSFVLLEDDLEAFWSDENRGCSAAVVEARLALYAPA